MKQAAQEFLDAMLTSLAEEPRMDHIVENITRLERMFDQKQAREAA